MRKPQIIKKYEKAVGEVEDWDNKLEREQEALVKMAKHMDSRGQLDEIIRK